MKKILVTIMILLLLVGCSGGKKKEIEKQLQGDWVREITSGLGTCLTFKDGNVVASLYLSGEKSPANEGVYEILEDELLITYNKSGTYSTEGGVISDMKTTDEKSQVTIQFTFENGELKLEGYEKY